MTHNISPPALRSKPAPCTPAEARAIAKKKADETEMPLVRYYAMCRTVGVNHIGMSVRPEGTSITLRGIFGGRNVAVDVLSPKGQPIALYAVQAFEEFKRGMGDEVPHLPPDVPLPDPDHVRIETHLDDRVPQGEMTPEKRQTFDDMVDDAREERWAKSGIPRSPVEEVRQCDPANLLAGTPEEIAARFQRLDPSTLSRDQLEAMAHVLKSTVGVVSASPAPMPASPNPEASPARADIAADLKHRSEAWVKHGDIRKAPAAGAGQRKPLSLPLCHQCKTQPVYNPGAEFCGGTCAKQFHINRIAAQKGIKLP